MKTFLNLNYLRIDLPLASSPSAVPIRLLIDRNSIKLFFYFHESSEHLPVCWSLQRIGGISSRSCRRQSAFLHAHLGDKFTVVRGPLICRPVISSLTTTQHFWLPGRRSCGGLGFPLSVPC